MTSHIKSHIEYLIQTF